MGVIKKIFHERLVNEAPDRNANLLRVYEKDNCEVVIHFRNLKINLITQEEIREWKEGFTEALNAISSNK